MSKALKPLLERRKPPAGNGDWLRGWVMGPQGARGYWIFRPAGVKFGERLPLMVMLHGCHQDAKSFAASTRMNAIAASQRFLVLYPEQDRLSNAQGCWNWFDTKSGRAHGEAASILLVVDQVCGLDAADRERVAIAGLSAGASMAALVAIRYPTRFKAVAMHSGVPPGAAHSPLSAVGAMLGNRRIPQPHASESSKNECPPLLVIHGSVDAVVSIQNADAAARRWSDAVGAREGMPREVRRGQRYPMTVTDFKCARSIVATLVQIECLGHAWSGGAGNQNFSDQKGPDASRMIWTFAAKQFGRSAVAQVGNAS